MIWLIPIAIALLLAGCDGVEVYPSTTTPPRPDFDKAMKIIWNDTFQSTAPYPVVNWVTNLDCACSAPYPCTGFKAMDVDLFDSCVGGRTTPDGRVYVASLSELYPYSYMPLAHELFHAYKFATTGDIDKDHRDPRWAAGGIVDEANDRLRAAGL